VDDLIWTLLGVAAVLLYLGTPFVAWSALRRTRALERRVERLLAELAASAPVPAPRAAEPVTLEPMTAEPLPQAAIPEAPAAGASPPEPGLETAVAERWLVWLGGVALALGGLFLAGWAIEQGWLGPQVRVAGAALLGLVLMALGERARGQPSAAGATRPDHVPAALVAGGLCSLYGATLAAHLLYALVGPALALGLLALVSVLGVGLGLRFGPLVALLGAVGAYLSPALVTTGTPSAWALFLFLSTLAPTLALAARLGRWPWLAWLDVAGAVLWQLAWPFLGPVAAAPGARALHLLLLAGGGLVLLALPDEPSPADPPPRRLAGLRWPLRAMVAAAAALHLPLLAATDHAAAVLAALVMLSVATVLVAARAEQERWLAAVVAAAGLLAAVIWRIPPLAEPTSQLRDPAVGLEPLFWVAPEAAPLATGLAACAAAYAGTGFLVLGRSSRPGFWAALSAAVPLLALVVAYGRLEGLAVSPGYAAIALGLAALALLAAERVARRPGLEPALAAYAVGVVGAIALGCTMTLEEAWLTVSLAVLLPAMAWIGRALALPALRGPAWVLAGIVIARVLLDAELPGSVPAWPPFRLLYTCGVPLLAFGLAARWFRQAPRDPLAVVLEGGALLFWLLLATQAIRSAASATGASPFGLGEASAVALAWLATGLALLRWQGTDPAALVPRFAALPLTAAAAVVVLAWSLADANPMLTGEPVGDWPVMNLLLAAYALPALLLALVGRELRRQGRPRLALAAMVGSQVLALVWLTLEVRHFFQGSRLDGPTGDAEWLAWSAAWLAWAGLLLVLGLMRDERGLRATALVVASLAVGKAFLFDLAELTGLYRAVSFLALGLCLIGIGWLYRRFVAAPAIPA
jgi:uncharacterized membrane protein